MIACDRDGDMSGTENPKRGFALGRQDIIAGQIRGSDRCFWAVRWTRGFEYGCVDCVTPPSVCYWGGSRRRKTKVDECRFNISFH